MQLMRKDAEAQFGPQREAAGHGDEDFAAVHYAVKASGAPRA